ncbi:MAG: iron-containing redox enzyme family protein [Myxococcota bacterium]|jgi:pyrroloquinoline-quinone synthase|nr:iron-containing redox enzyme family protein [Myxococcota bacterium]
MVDALIAEILEETDAWNNPYLVALRDGSFEREDFLETQVQFYFAVVFFSRPMAAVAAKIPSARLRVEILRNVWEEHGEGDQGDTHGSTFLTLLHRLGGISSEQVDERALWPEVRQFNTTLTGACVMDEYLVGVGVMGIIERMFADISAWLGQGIVERGWLTADQVVHYNLHQQLDVKHADDFFAVLRPAWESGGNAERYMVEQGLRLGAHSFSALFEQLHRARKQRRMRCYLGPHLRT